MSRSAWMVGAWVACAVAACGRDGRTAVKVRAEAGDVAIVGATVVPMDRAGTLAGHTVLVRGDRIVAVAAAAEIDTRSATVVDATGKWLVPGLADMHVHMWNQGDLDLFLLNGVTTIRNLFGSPEHLRWRDAIARGELRGPTLVTSGPIIDGDPPVWPGSAVITTAEAARAEVRAEKVAGYDWIKVYNGLSAEAYAAILDEAATQGLPVGGHVPGSVGIDEAIASGQRSIEHLEGYIPFFGEPVADPPIKATVAAGTWNCPTLVVTDRMGKLDTPEQLATTRGLELMSPTVRAMWDPTNDFRLRTWKPEQFAALRTKNQRRRQLVRELAAAGAHLVLGTDTGNPFVVPGFAVVDELGLLVEAGLTPWQALRMATAAAGELLGTPGAFGVIAAGARADLIVIDADPLADVRAVADPAVVIVRGVPHPRAELMAVATAPAPSPGDRLAALPALEVEGTELVPARYEAVMLDQVIGAERVVVSHLADRAVVVRGQAVYTVPAAMQITYRSTADALDLTTDALSPAHAAVTRKGPAVVGVQDTKPAIERAAAADAVIAPQTIAEYVWYATKLADLGVGKARTVAAVEVRTDGVLALDPGAFTFTRTADAGGRRVYAFTSTQGAMALTGTLRVDRDGAPAELTADFGGGSYMLRRLSP